MRHVQRLVQSLGRAHGSLDDKTAHVLPALLQQRDQVVDGQHDVGDELILAHVDVANRNTQAQDLLELELDCALDLSDLGVQVLGVRDGSWEFAGLGQTRTQETRDLLDQSLRGHKGVVLVGQLLDQLLVLVELLEIVGRHGIDTMVLRAIDIVLVTEDADGHAGAGDGGKLDGARETLVTLGIIVLQADLKFDGLEEIALLGVLRVIE